MVVIGVADVFGDVEKIYQEQNRKAVVRLRRAEKAFAAAEKELAEAVKVADALDVLADGRFGLGSASRSELSHALWEELAKYRFVVFGTVQGNYSVAKDFLARFDAEYPVTEKALEIWAEQLVDLTEYARRRNIRVEPWRVWLRVSFDDDVAEFVRVYAEKLGMVAAVQV